MYADFEKCSYPSKILQQCYFMLFRLLKSNKLNVENVFKILKNKCNIPSRDKIPEFEKAFFNFVQIIVDSMSISPL